MDDAVPDKLAALEREQQELESRINDLSRRLGNGEVLVRGELNPAIARHQKVSRELYELQASLGLLPRASQILYGPPPNFARSGDGNDDE